MNRAVGPPSVDPAFAKDLPEVADALEALRPYLLSVAEREIGPELKQKAGASDLVQETLLQACRVSPDAAPHSPDALRAWLRAILVRRISDLRRQYEQTQKRRIHREIRLGSTSETEPERLRDPAARTPSSIASTKEHNRRLEEALGGLSPEHRQVLELRVRQGRAFAEVAQTMHRSEEAVQMLFLRALQSLKREFRRSP